MEKKIDPDMIPSPIAVMQIDVDNNGGKDWGTGSRGINVPLASTWFRCFDQGIYQSKDRRS